MMDRRTEGNRRKVWPQEKSLIIQEQRTVSRPEGYDQAFGPGQLADDKTMPGVSRVAIWFRARR
jgi:hypothetical protein